MRVTLLGKETSLVLEDRGPLPSEADVRAFEQDLGFALPADYREFLLRYNGGSPVVMDFKVIGDDAGGNAIAMRASGEIRFVNHERLDEPYTAHRVIADSFTDLLQRFVSVEEDAARQAAERAAEREAIAHGPLPPDVEAQCVALAPDHPELRAWIRAAFLAVFDAKGYFAVHDDEHSRAVLDLVLWMAQKTTLPGALTAQAVQDLLLSRAWGTNAGGPWFAGYAPGFIDDWWADREQRGMILEGRFVGTPAPLTGR